jgi:prolyl 4-hydroxylase
MDAISRQELELRAMAGDAEAPLLLADQLAQEGDRESALTWLRHACAGSGDIAPTAARLALARHVLNEPGSGSAVEGILGAVSAGADGNAEAAHLTAALCGGGITVRQSWPTALTWLQRAAELGHDGARRQLVALASDRALAARVEGGAAEGDVWRRLRATVDVGAWTRSPRPRVHSISPRIGIIEKFLPAEWCDWLVAKAQPGLAPAQTFDHATGSLGYESGRTNSAAYFRLPDFDFVLLFARARMAAAAGLPVGALEATAVLHYRPGQEFAPHFDFFDPETQGYEGNVREEGQRVLTFLTYLNDGYEGGETDFPLLPWRHKGRKGDAMFFWNVAPDHAPDRRTLHAGLSPASGEKYVLSQWARARTQVAR